MTREEAIRIIKTVFQDEYVYKYYDSITHQALNMAIEALQADAVQGGDAEMDNCQVQAPQNYMQQSRHNDGTDLISRADAMAEFREWVKRANENGEAPTWNDAVSLIGSLPSADAVHGEWIDRSEGGRILIPWWESHKCDQCGYVGSGVWRFCPNCGARMIGGEDE